MTFGKLLTAIGVVLVVIGLVVSYAPWLISWLDEAAIAENPLRTVSR